MKIKTLEKNRYSIITDNMNYCFVCGKPAQHLHEVIFGKNRVNSMKYGLVIPVCLYCHNFIHSNSDIQLKHKQIAQKKFMEYYDIDFIEVFKKNYL